MSEPLMPWPRAGELAAFDFAHATGVCDGLSSRFFGVSTPQSWGAM